MYIMLNRPRSRSDSNWLWTTWWTDSPHSILLFNCYGWEILRSILQSVQSFKNIMRTSLLTIFTRIFPFIFNKLTKLEKLKKIYILVYNLLFSGTILTLCILGSINWFNVQNSSPMTAWKQIPLLRVLVTQINSCKGETILPQEIKWLKFIFCIVTIND